MRPMLILGGRLIDPSQGIDARVDLLLADGTVTRVGERLEAPDGAEVVDASGLVVCPGLIDVHVHLREPGGEHKETIASGTRAAAAGGFTSVVAMPNTDPPIDNPAAVGYVRAEGLRAQGTRVHPTGCITVGQRGERLTEVGELMNAGAVAITDDGRPVSNAGTMRRALEYAQTFDCPVTVHCEDLTLSDGGSMNEGAIASRLGLHGIPNAAEDVMLARDLILAELTGGRLHVQHVSTAAGVRMIRESKARGVRVTAEATPHHIALTDAAVEAYRTDAKVNPPLRSEADRAAVRDGAIDGTLDVIATDHAPHHYDEKERAFGDAPFGLVGLETSLGVVLTELVHTGTLKLPLLVERMSCAPARAMSLPGGTLAVGSPGDVTIFDPDTEWTVEPADFRSLSRNTPFAGRALRGRPVRTVVCGQTIWSLDAKETR